MVLYLCLENLFGLILGRTSCGKMSQGIKNKNRYLLNVREGAKKFYVGGKNAMFWVLTRESTP